MLAHSGGLTKSVVSGWNFNWIFTYSSGYPVAQPTWIRNLASPQLNLTLARTFTLSERIKLQLRCESFNAANTPLYNGPVTDFKDPRFGQLPLAQPNFPRLVQIAGKILF